MPPKQANKQTQKKSITRAPSKSKAKTGRRSSAKHSAAMEEEDMKSSGEEEVEGEDLTYRGRQGKCDPL